MDQPTYSQPTDDRPIADGPREDPAAAAIEPQPAAAGDRLRRLWREWIRPLLVVLVVMGSFRSALADWNDVPSGSMKPTIVEGDRIFVNKAAYGLRMPFTRQWLLHWGEPERGDIVVLFSPDDEKRLVKRVVGLPGDRLEERYGRLLINGEPVRYTPIEPGSVPALDAAELNGSWLAEEDLGEVQHPIVLPTLRQRGGAGPFGSRGFHGPVVVPPDHYFVMGDNRPHSRDSREIGFVERSRIVGRATAVVLSIDKEEYFRPRWDRFFQRLR